MKQGEGTLVLPAAVNTHTGETNVWQGSLHFDGTMEMSPVWLNRHTTLLSDGGRFMGGLRADYERVYEPVLDLDVDADSDREQWTRFGVLEPQAYMRYGVATDGNLHCLKRGKPINNLHAIGSVLSGHDAIKMGDGTGVSLLTALAVAHDILA